MTTPTATSATKKPPLGRPFWVVWWAAAISFAGDGLYIGAVPLIAASITRDPGALSLTTVISQGGWLAVGLLSGVLVDRWSKTRVMWQVDVLRAAVLATFAVLLLTGHSSMALIYGVSLVLGLATPFFDNASSALLPQVVADENLERANAWNQNALLLGASLVGPPVGAALFVWDAAAPVALVAASCALSALLIGTLRPRIPHTPPPLENRSLRRELVEGLSYLARHRLLRTLCLLLAAINAVTGVVLALLVLYVLQVLDYPEAAYGWLIAVFALGGLAGASIVSRLKDRVGSFTAIMLAAAGFTVGTLLMGLLPYLPFVIAGIVVTGVGSALWNVITYSLRQRIVPAELLGRVTSAYRMVGVGALPLGAAAGGALATATSVQTAYVLAGVALAAATLAAAAPLRAGLAAHETAADPGSPSL